MTNSQTQTTALLCDEDGSVAMCDNCGQIHSPYWAASKSKWMHAKGTGHKVRVMHASEALKLR